MKNILITGGAGFIGANFVHYWLNQYPQDKVVVLDALTYAGNLQNLESAQSQENFSFVEGNITDQALIDDIMHDHQIDTIVHFAAESHVDRSISGPDVFIETNIVGTHALLKAAKKAWIDEKKVSNTRFHHISTDEVYGTLTLDDPAFTEQTRYAPNSPYSASKASSDHLARAYQETYGLPVTISNCSNNYGPYQHQEKLIPLLIKHVLHGKSLPIYGDGKNIRDWLYVEDHCRALDLILQKGRVGEVYNVGGCNELTNLEIVEHVTTIIDNLFKKDPKLAEIFPDCPAVKQIPTKSLLEFVPDRLGHDRRYAINAEKISTEIGFQPKETFATGIAKTIDWYIVG